MQSFVNPARLGEPVTPPAPRNQLALISLLLSPVFLLALLADLAGAFGTSLHISALAGAMAVGMILTPLGVPAFIAAIVIGHIALMRAKRYPPAQAQRWMAITGLVLGYLSAAFVAGIMAIFIVAGFHGF